MQEEKEVDPLYGLYRPLPQEEQDGWPCKLLYVPPGQLVQERLLYAEENCPGLQGVQVEPVLELEYPGLQGVQKEEEEEEVSPDAQGEHSVCPG